MRILTRRRSALFAALVVFLACAYLLTYSGRIESGDSFHLFDAVSSLVDFGDIRLDLSLSTRPPQTFDDITAYPLNTVDAEPLQIILATPLYWLAERLPGVGLAHAVWLFNIFVAAAAGGVLFVYALALGYEERVALLASLAFAFGTIIWPYSKTFFREPLTLLMLLLAGYFAERLHTARYRSPVLLLAFLLALVGLLLAKATAALALPALFLIALPTISRANRRRVLVGSVLALLSAGAVFVALAAFGDELGIGTRYNPVARLIEGSQSFLPVALHSYLISPGGSVWGTSPITLLALPGLYLLVRRGRLRYVAVVLLMLLAFAVGYSASSGEFWFGGLSWPPRFLIPVVPYLIIAALPAFDWLARHPSARWLRAGALVLMLYSLWVQFSAVSLWWGAYTAGLPPEARGLLEWGGGLNLLAYLRWVVIPRLWSQFPFDFAFVRVNVPIWLVGFAGLTVAAGLWLRRLLHRGMPEGRGRYLGWLLPVALAASLVVGLRLIYVDPYYFPANQGLFPALEIIDAETNAGDVVLLSNRTYERFFLNYGKFESGVRVITLPMQRGDRPSPEQPPRVEAANPDMLLTNLTIPTIRALALTRERLFLLEDGGPDIPWKVRPVEQFMATHFYPIRVITTDPAVRLLEYSTVPAPDPYAFRGPETLADLRYGDELRLVGYTLPRGDTYAPGQALPISLYWHAETAPTRDYRVAWFLRTEDGAPVAQGMDTRPRGDFENTSAWHVGFRLWDNRALRLPADLAPGDYRLWVKVYHLDETYTPRDLPVSGGDALDATIGLLPTVIHVR